MFILELSKAWLFLIFVIGQLKMPITPTKKKKNLTLGVPTIINMNHNFICLYILFVKSQLLCFFYLSYGGSIALCLHM
jgi:hypothetical protein